MKTILRLAWRNIWRNKRRTLITASSITFALFFALIMRAFQIGSYAHLIDNMVQSYTGYIQIHQKGYWNDKTIDNSFEADKGLIDKISDIPNVTALIPRLEYFALASEGQKTKGVAVCGTDPVAETKLTRLSKKIIAGKYLEKGDSTAMVAEGLANYLILKVGDTLVLIGNGYHGTSAAEKYIISGILHFPTPSLNNQLVYLNLETAQNFFSAPGRITSLALNIKNINCLTAINQQVNTIVSSDDYEVLDWKIMLGDWVSMIKMKQGSSFILLSILYMVVAFGIFGTLMMMVSERIREFGMMIALGMKKIKIAGVVMIEMLFLSFIGIISGITISLPIILYYYHHPLHLVGQTAKTMIDYDIEPVMPVALQSDYFINQCLVILIIVSLALIYPFVRIIRLKLIEALRR